MDKNTVLMVLLKLEKMRIRVDENPKSYSMDDSTIRICQAEIASEFFSDRKEWTNILQREHGLIY